VTKLADHIPTGLAGVTGLILYRFSHMAVQPDLRAAAAADVSLY